MKFAVEVNGKCSVNDCVCNAVTKSLKAKKIKAGSPEWELAFEKEYARLAKLVFRFVDDGNDVVRLEFDDEAKTVRVLPKRRKK